MKAMAAPAPPAAAQQLLAQGAEVIVGPLFGASVQAVAPIARDRGMPVLAFSTEKSVAGNGTYLLSFLPQNEVRRVVRYAAANGHHVFAALVPQTAYGDVAQEAFRDSVTGDEWRDRRCRTLSPAMPARCRRPPAPSPRAAPMPCWSPRAASC